MSGKRISVEIRGGEIDLDFEGYHGNSCSEEEDKIRALYGAMGVKTDVKHSDNKREDKEVETYRGRETA